MDTENLEKLVCSFGEEASAVPGALGASAAIERYGIPALQLAGGAQGLRLLREIPDEETGETVRRQNMTVFPAPALLACSFDPDVIRAVGRAVGLEMAESACSCGSGRTRTSCERRRRRAAPEQWSEDRSSAAR